MDDLHLNNIMKLQNNNNRAWTLSILWCNQYNDNPQEDLAKFGNKLSMNFF
jgi:hypothetical protein